MPIEPTLAEVIRTAIDDRLLDLHTMLPGRVESYDALTQTASVVPVIKRPLTVNDGSTVHEKLPVISNVPIVWPGGGGFSLHFPLAKGDHVMLVFSEAATAAWRSTGQISEPGDRALHDLSYPFAIPRVAPMSTPILDPGSPTEATVIVPTGATLRISGVGGAVAAKAVALADPMLAWVDALITQLGAVPATAAVGAAMATATTALHAALAAAKLKAQ